LDLNHKVSILYSRPPSSSSTGAALLLLLLLLLRARSRRLHGLQAAGAVVEQHRRGTLPLPCPPVLLRCAHNSGGTCNCVGAACVTKVIALLLLLLLRLLLLLLLLAHVTGFPLQFSGTIDRGQPLLHNPTLHHDPRP
jgi:hypothetical protein